MINSLLQEKTVEPIATFNSKNTTGLVFIDPKVTDYEMLMAGVTPDLEVVLLDENLDPIGQITEVLKGRSGLSSLHLVAHGEAGSLWLGNKLVNSKTLDQQKDDLLSWKAALAIDADILIYGGKVAAGEKGQQFVKLLGQLTGAEVAASRNLTGNVEAPLAFGAQTMEAYRAVFTTTRVSVSSDGTQGNGSSYYPSISADGRYVAFYSSASNLVSDDTSNTFDVFVYDTVTKTTRRVSVSSGGNQGSSSSMSPSISADGRYVAFDSFADNLVSGDTNGTSDIFVYDTVTNTTRRVSVGYYYSQGNSSSYLPSISADGRYVAFTSDASNLVSGDTNYKRDIFVHDTVANTTRRVSVATDGTQPNDYSYNPSISADGRYVAFESFASNLVSGDTNTFWDVFVHDTVTNTTRRVSVASDGTQGNSQSQSPSISADGRYVAFESSASNLVSGDNYGSDIFIYDTVTNTTRLVSIASDGTKGNDNSYKPSISADGRYVAFSSFASNLVDGDIDETNDIFVYDTVANTTRRVSVASDGTQGNNSLNYFYYEAPSISADGSRVVFTFDATNLVSGDTNNAPDIFLYESSNVTQNPWTGTSGDDTYTYTGTADFTGNGLAGNDTIVGGIANDYILGGAGNDWIKGGLGKDILNGNEGNDYVYGGRNHDLLIGEGGADFLWGSLGNDVLVGYGLTANAIDTLVGGRGADTFGVGINFTYFGGTGSIPGYSSNGDADYALIKDFTTSDVIELYGNINQYTFSSGNVVGSDTLDTLIYWKVENSLELVAVVQDVTNVPVNNLVFLT